MEALAPNRHTRRALLAGAGAAALALPLAACQTTGGTNIVPVVTRVEDIISRCQQIVGTFCTYVPTASTLAGIILAIVGAFTALPVGASGIEALAQQVAKTFCDAVAKKMAQGVRPRLTRRTSSRRDAAAGRPIISWGPATINGQAVDIEVLG